MGLQLLSRGRLVPTLSPRSVDAWRVGPLDTADEEILDRMAAALPAEAYAASVTGVPPFLLTEPRYLVGAFLDALADVYPRTPAAEGLGGRAGSPRAASTFCRSCASGPTAPRRWLRGCG
ncbi:hypothetical protein [Streptomyces sp. CAU 1734]|uniref:hypothetical protein n=1 Tax=Streptomyces sp. CAU 1734 TaxID=3140360 RepID=UPI0032616D0F